MDKLPGMTVDLFADRTPEQQARIDALHRDLPGILLRTLNAATAALPEFVRSRKELLRDLELSRNAQRTPRRKGVSRLCRVLGPLCRRADR